MLLQNKLTGPNTGALKAFMDKIDKVYLLVAGIFMGIAFIDPSQVMPLAKLTVTNLAHTSIYLAAAVILVAALKASGGETIVARIFKGRENRMIILAALVGGLAPFCSCEVIPFIAGLLALGTPLAPIMAFWLSSPLIDPPTLLITAASLGMKFALAKAVFAVMLGLFGGFFVKLLQNRSKITSPELFPKPASHLSCCSSAFPVVEEPCCAKKASADPTFDWRIWKDEQRKKTFVVELQANGLFLLKWMFFAYSLESIMIQYIPAHVIASVVGGDGVSAIIVSALVGVPAYLNSYIAPPVVSSLMAQGMSPGSGMAFIMAGAVTSIPAMTAVFALVQRKIFALYVILGFLGAVISGIIYNLMG